MKDILIKNITELTKEDETYIVENLVEISKGRNSNYDLYTIVVKILQFLEKQTEKTRYGAISEFFVLKTLKEEKFEQEYCFRNLEENSIKNGFDGVFLKENTFWLMESKSTKTKSHKTNIDKAYNGIKNQIEGNTENDPWENAVNHAKAAESKKNLIEKLTELSRQHTLGKFSELQNSNIILGSTVINNNIDSSVVDKEELIKYIDNHVSKKEILVSVNLASERHFIELLEKIKKNEEYS